MTFLLIALILLCLPGLSFQKTGIRSGYMDRSSTTAVNGIFVLLVFLRHVKTYIDHGPADRLFLLFDRGLGQLIVIPFLFYSGYGIMQAVRAKGRSYILAFPLRRIGKVWSHFALALLLYAAAAPLSGRTCSPRQFLMALTGFTSIGNSNWYMFALLALYLITLLCGLLFIREDAAAQKASAGPAKEKAARSALLRFCAAAAVLTILYMLVMSRIREHYFYDTAFVFPAGMAFALFQGEFEAFLLQKKSRYALLAAVSACLLAAASLWKYYRPGIPADIVWSLSFAMLLVLVTMKVKAGNRVLRYLGSLSFEIYILQRLPMNLLKGRIADKYLYIAACAAATLLLAQLFRLLTKKTDALLPGAR